MKKIILSLLILSGGVFTCTNIQSITFVNHGKLEIDLIHSAYLLAGALVRYKEDFDRCIEKESPRELTKQEIQDHYLVDLIKIIYSCKERRKRYENYRHDSEITGSLRSDLEFIIEMIDVCLPCFMRIKNSLIKPS